MDWALGIAMHGGEMRGEILNTQGHTTRVELAALGTIGVPTTQNPSFKRLNFDFSDLVPASQDEYLEGMDITLPAHASTRQLVWEMTERRVRILMPALALMRALFRPTSYLLPTMFRPQALDRVCFVDHGTEQPRIVIDAFWGQDGYACRQGEVEDPLAWMKGFPSASQAAASVHEHALSGVIGFQLPEGRARANLRGRKVGNTLFVTNMNFYSLRTDEAPFANMAGNRREFFFRKNGGREADSIAESYEIEVPRHSDGTVALTDSEWQAVEALLLQGQRRAAERLNQRDILDAILQKVSSGTPWRDMKYKSGNWLNARYALRSWTGRGTLEASLCLLRELRSPETSTLTADSDAHSELD